MNECSKKIMRELTAGIKDVLVKAFTQTFTDMLHKTLQPVKKYRSRRHRRRAVKSIKLIHLQ